MLKSPCTPTAAVVLCLLCLTPNVIAVAAECPAGPRSVTFSGLLNSQSLVDTHRVNMAPCETMLVRLTGSVGGQPTVAISVSVSLKNSAGTTLASASAQCLVASGCPLLTVPQPVGNSGTPLAGTVGDGGRASSIVVSIMRPSLTTAELGYQVTADSVPRPGYNEGSDTLGGAPLLAESPAAVNGSLLWAAPGQYFRVRLAQGGTLQVAGTLAVGCSSCYGGIFRTEVYASSGTLLAQIASASYGSNYGVKAFTSSVFTNTSGQPAELVLKFAVLPTMAPTLHDMRLTVTWTEGPELKLFVVRDGAFEATAPHSEHDSFIPGAAADGSSVEIGEGSGSGPAQTLELVAAYVNASGAIVAKPPYSSGQVSFHLTGTSAFTGYAMNAGTNAAADFSLGAESAAFLADQTARTTLLCHDYGGFTNVSADDGVQATATIRLPADTDGNRLPDAGWVSGAGLITTTGLSAEDDSDPDPFADGLPVEGTVGDGLSAFEEFRGFLVMGAHTRSSPVRKDVFLTGSIGFAENLPLDVHVVNDPAAEARAPWALVELEPNRHVNFNRTNSGAGGEIPGFDQGALRILTVEDETLIDPCSIGTFGYTFHQATPRPYVTPCAFEPPEMTPNEVAIIEVYPNAIRECTTIEYSNCGLPAPLNEEQVSNEIKRTIGHEVGHGLHVRHNPQQPPPVGLNIMSSVVTGGGPTDPSSQYDDPLRRQIRLQQVRQPR